MHDTQVEGIYHRVYQLYTIVIWRVVTCGDHYPNNLSILESGSQGCKKTDSKDDGVEESTTIELIVSDAHIHLASSEAGRGFLKVAEDLMGTTHAFMRNCG